MATMLTYAYKGTDTTGKQVKGKVDAINETQVALRLRAMGVAPSSIRESVGGHRAQHGDQVRRWLAAADRSA